MGWFNIGCENESKELIRQVKSVACTAGDQPTEAARGALETDLEEGIVELSGAPRNKSTFWLTLPPQEGPPADCLSPLFLTSWQVNPCAMGKSPKVNTHSPLILPGE